MSLAVIAILAGTAAADEIQRWRDADGQEHLRIVGQPEARKGSSSTGMTLEERFSVETSLRRRDVERRLRTASAEIRRIEGEQRATMSRQLVVYAPPAPTDPSSAQFVLDAQRNAFLTARAFEHEQSDLLEKLGFERHDRLVEVRALWKEFEDLRALVEEHYGKRPVWWRDRLDGDLVSDGEAEAALRAEKERPIPPPFLPTPAVASDSQVLDPAPGGASALEPEQLR